MLAKRVRDLVSHDCGELVVGELQPLDEAAVDNHFAAGHCPRVQLRVVYHMCFPRPSRRVGSQRAGLRNDPRGDRAHTLEDRRVAIERALCRASEMTFTYSPAAA